MKSNQIKIFKRLVYVLIFSINFIYFTVNAQFTGPTPSPPCDNVPSSFSSNSKGNTFIYSFENNPYLDFSLSTLPSNSVAYNSGGLSTPTYNATLNDNGIWYSFVGNYTSNTISRLDYGNSPLNIPTLTNIGTFGSGSLLEGVSILKDSNNSWFGFTVNNNQLIRWQFANNNLGSSAINITTMSFPTSLQWPHQISIKEFDPVQGFIGFVANRNGSISRLDFGSSLLNTPILTDLPSTITTACNFVLFEQKKSWYMITTNLLSHSISRIEFGSNIKNNNPVVTNLGNIGGLFNLPRGISLFPNCEPNQLFGYILNENGSFIKLDFNGDITNTPVGNSLGTLGSFGFNDLSVFSFGNNIYSFSINYSNNSLTRMNLFNIPTPFDIKYNASPTTHLYSAGVHTATLFVDPGSTMGSQTFCNTFKVDSCHTNGFTSINMEKDYVLYQNYPNPFKRSTQINYKISKKTKTANIIIYDLNGKELLKFLISSEDKTGLELNNKELAPGIYFYSMIIDGRKMDTKKMIID